MSLEQVTVIADGEVYEEWASITVSAEYGSPATLISLETTEVMEGANIQSPFTKWNFPPGTIITIFASGTHIATAVVDVYRPSGFPTSHKVSIRARGPARKGVDSSVDPRNLQGAFHNEPFCSIVRKLWGSITGGFDVAVGCDPSLESDLIKYHQIQQGASPYKESMRLAPLVGAHIKPILQSGGIHFATGEAMQHSTGYVVQGTNIISMSAEISSWPRANVIEAIGQDPLEMDRQFLEMSAIETDGGASPGSYHRHIVQGYPTPNNVRNYAKWARSVTFGQAVKARIQVPGWRVMHPDAQGVLQPLSQVWEVGELVTVYSKWLKIDCDMFIMGVEFHQSQKGGTTTTLTLSDPRAAGAKANPGTGSYSRCDQGNNIWVWD